MSQRITFHLGDILHPKKGGVEHELIIHLIAEVILIVLFYYLTKPKGVKQTIPYPSLIQQTYANNQLTQALERLREG